VRVEAGGQTLTEQSGQSSVLPITVRVPEEAVVHYAPWEVRASFVVCADGGAGQCIPIEETWVVPMAAGRRRSPILLEASLPPGWAG
jgi:hypothetical protein